MVELYVSSRIAFTLSLTSFSCTEMLAREVVRSHTSRELVDKTD
jgi:hypothetical protein